MERQSHTPAASSACHGATDSAMTSQHHATYQHADAATTSHADEAAASQHRVGTVQLHGVQIVSLTIEMQERLCLAQISNTLLKDFSYNEIHNRRVALGITCVQCTPVQLEILRRAGAMPISSRRCGMITKREAERLVKSFLEEHEPPKLPENFAFRVRHTCGWGCHGQFLPARYNSSRAKCIKCDYCSMYYSPNKFIFHFHRLSDASYRHPDAANFNSWRRHLMLDYEAPNEFLIHAWEDVKAMFNGGSRKRVSMTSLAPATSGDSSDDTYTQKRPRFRVDDVLLDAKPPQAPYPFLPLPGVHTTPNMMLPFQMPHTHPTHPMLPAPDAKANECSTKCSIVESWQNKTHNQSFYNPFGLLWAKTFGMYPFQGNMAMTSPAFGWNQAATSSKTAKITTLDEHYSAFKPVSVFTAPDRDSACTTTPPALAARPSHGPRRWWSKSDRDHKTSTDVTEDMTAGSTSADAAAAANQDNSDKSDIAGSDEGQRKRLSSDSSDVSVDDVINDKPLEDTLPKQTTNGPAQTVSTLQCLHIDIHV